MILLVVVFFVIFEAGAVIINPRGPTVINDFKNCLCALMEFNFNKSGLLVFGTTNNMSTTVARIGEGLLSKIHESSRYSVEVKNPTDEPPICYDNNDEEEDLSVVHMDQFTAVPLGDYFVTIIDKYEDFARVISRFIRSRNWNPHAKFIILFLPSTITEKGNIQNAEKIISCLFKHNVINVLIAVSDARNIRKAIIYSWTPFEPPKYCGYFNETAKNRLVAENSCEHGVIRIEKDSFRHRIPNNMSGCAIYLLALKRQPFIGDDPADPNIEKKFIDELASIYNFETHYELVDGFRGEKNEEGDWDGALGKLTAKRGQLLLGGIFPDNDVHEDFECSTTYLADSYTWVVPRAKQLPPWVALIIIFQDIVWYCVIASYFLCAVSWKVIGHFSNDTIYHRTLRHSFLNTWVCTLGFCSYVRPVKESLRVFYVFFNLYCILFLTAYQTKLFDVLTNPAFEDQVDTMEELVDSGLKYGGFEELHDLFLNSSDPFDFHLGENWQDVENLTEALLSVVVHRNFSLLCSRFELAHMSAILPELSDSLGNYRYFAFEQDVFTVPVEMVALQGFSFMRKFSRSMELLKQLGANARLRYSFADQNARKMARLQHSLASEGPEVDPLSLLHLQGGFLALLMGYLGGAVALATEIFVNSEFTQKKLSEWENHFKTRCR